MTHDELIEAGGMAIFEVSPDRKAGTWLEAHFQTRAKYRNLARAAIRLIAPAVLEEAAGVAMRAVLAASLSKAVWDDVSALKTRYEQ